MADSREITATCPTTGRTFGLSLYVDKSSSFDVEMTRSCVCCGETHRVVVQANEVVSVDGVTYRRKYGRHWWPPLYRIRKDTNG